MSFKIKVAKSQNHIIQMFLKYIWFKSIYQHRHNMYYINGYWHTLCMSLILWSYKLQVWLSQMSRLSLSCQGENFFFLFFAEIQEVAPKIRKTQFGQNLYKVFISWNLEIWFNAISSDFLWWKVRQISPNISLNRCGVEIKF